NSPGTITINGAGNTHFDGFLVDGNGNSTLALVLASTNTGSLENRGTLNTYSGGTTINGGTLRVSSDSNLGASTGSITLGGGNLVVSAGFDTNRPITINPGGGTIEVASGTLVNITGSGATNWNGGSLSVKGTGSVTITRSGSTISVVPG